MIAPRPLKPGTRPRTRKNMTLIAALKCKNSADQDVAVFLADRQESFGNFRSFIDKLQYGTEGHVDFIMGGSGIGALVDVFISKLRDDLRGGSFKGRTDLNEQISCTLKRFYTNEVRHYPAKRSEKDFWCLIGLRLSTSSEVFTWEVDGPALREVSKYSLIGHEAAIYTHEVERLYRQRLSVAQTIHLGIHLFQLAKQTSRWVDGPTQVVLLLPDGVYFEDQLDMDVIEQNISQLYRVLDDMLLSFMDAGLSKVQFDEKVEWLVGKVRYLRQIAVQCGAQRKIRKWPDRMFEHDPYPVFPPGGSFTVGYGPTVVRELAEVPAHIQRSLEEMRRQEGKELASTRGDCKLDETSTRQTELPGEDDGLKDDKK
jgi:hypothetical protein